jgi:hypothetical protein
MFLKGVKNNINFILTILGVCLFLVAASFSYVNYFENKDFIMSLESSCDSESENCFYRSCTEEECPPNQLEVYKKVEVPAWFFANCTENSCSKECNSEPGYCKITYCDSESDDDSCFSPLIENEN